MNVFTLDSGGDCGRHLLRYQCDQRPGVKRPSIENRPIASRSQYPSSGVRGIAFPRIGSGGIHFREHSWANVVPLCTISSLVEGIVAANSG